MLPTATRSNPRCHRAWLPGCRFLHPQNASPFCRSDGCNIWLSTRGCSVGYSPMAGKSATMAGAVDPTAFNLDGHLVSKEKEAQNSPRLSPVREWDFRQYDQTR